MLTVLVIDDELDLGQLPAFERLHVVHRPHGDDIAIQLRLLQPTLALLDFDLGDGRLDGLDLQRICGAHGVPVVSISSNPIGIGAMIHEGARFCRKELVPSFLVRLNRLQECSPTERVESALCDIEPP